MSDPRIAAKYPYSYATPDDPDVGICTAVVDPSLEEDYIQSLVDNGVDTRTIEQTATLIPSDSRQFGLQIALTSQPCLQTLVNIMQDLPASTDPLTAIDIAAGETDHAYAHGGNPGQLILSTRPIENVTVVPYTTFLIRRANVFATIAGTRFAFSQWPTNYVRDINPDLGSLQTGPCKPRWRRTRSSRAPTSSSAI